MTRICVAVHSFQHSAQIRASMSAPSEPGSPTFPAPSRSCPHRAQTTTAMRQVYKRPSPKPADSSDRSVAEDRAPEDVQELYRTERPAVGALLRPVTEHGAGSVLDRRDPLEQQTLRIARVAKEDDLPDSRRSRRPPDDDPVAGAEGGLHAPARHRDP